MEYPKCHPTKDPCEPPQGSQLKYGSLMRKTVEADPHMILRRILRSLDVARDSFSGLPIVDQ